ncbi:histidine phosphatase family protein [Acetobacter okinawensis]|uniref:Phosphoglycerate mutase n=2 Tax=Acetobacter TaxID=434 RepID=A0A252BSS8_9PROT|nr:histidine phosphatase family protein [Acetobacter okinawensis]MBS0967074.1 histidine phosphatase family protein [Acetobacter okinawensis]MBS0990073.1 histidine phosphatase family protein [Acetobacter okinawensis]MCP1212867.1 histidine phosphatase family protein [Acetobacter okinawensis]OUJ11625.1 phosphoglycerate mutase [Acetobacter okinawensis]
MSEHMIAEKASSSSQEHFLDGPELPTGITRFWLIRHALVEENARMCMYGSMDVPLCPDSLIAQRPMYRALAARLPQDAQWFISPLSRTRRTAQAIEEAGYGARPLTVEPDLIEQNLGAWQGLEYHALPAHLTLPPHPFWPVAASDCPPGGESVIEVCSRVGRLLDRLARTHAGRNIVAVAHGGVIRAALAHALRIHAETALHFSVQNLSLTILERLDTGWRVVTVNELPGI